MPAMEGLANRLDHLGAHKDHQHREQELAGFDDDGFPRGELLQAAEIALPFAPMHQPIPFDHRNQQEQRQQVGQHDGNHAPAGAEYAVPGSYRVENEQQRFDHPVEVLTMGSYAGNLIPEPIALIYRHWPGYSVQLRARQINSLPLPHNPWLTRADESQPDR